MQRGRMTSKGRGVVLGFFLGTFLFVGASQVQGASLSKDLKSGKKEIEFSGKESGTLKIPKGKTVIGSGPEKATISGNVIMADNTTLKNLTVKGGDISITVEKGASIVLENVTVTGGSNAGIYAPKGAGQITLKNTRVRQNRKGVFVLGGGRVNISGSAITDNQEEGLDMHAGVSETITGSTFAQNKEGGVEVIINGSNLTLSGNTFSGNRASGIAFQSYGSGGGGAKTGSFTLSGNTFGSNGNYGIDCKNPLGTGGAFFAQSVTASGNTFTANKKGSINPECGIRNQAQKQSMDASEDKVITEEAEEIEEETLEEELAEEFEMETLANLILVRSERIEELETQIAALEERQDQYLATAQWFTQIGILSQHRQRTNETLQSDVMATRQLVEGCLPVDTYEVSALLDTTKILCEKAKKDELVATLESIEKNLKKETPLMERVKYHWHRLFSTSFTRRMEVLMNFF